VLADADEFLIYPNCETLSIQHYTKGLETEGAEVVRVDMVDMYPLEDLVAADFLKQLPFDAAAWFDKPYMTPWRLGSGWFSNAPSFVSHLRHRLIPETVSHDFVSQKFALFRYQPWVRFSQGIHYAANLNVSSQPAWFAHFKYHAEFEKKVKTEIHRAQHYNNAAEYRRYAAMLAESRGGFCAEGISVQYLGSHSFMELDNSEDLFSGSQASATIQENTDKL